MPIPPPPDQDTPLPLGMLIGVAVVATLTHILKVASRGEQFTRQTLPRQAAEALLTGIVAAGIWSALREFTALQNTAGVAIAAGVGLLGVRYVTGLLEQIIKSKLPQGDDDQDGPTPPPAVEAAP